MAKQTLDWHRECYKNFTASVRQQQEKVDRERDHLGRMVIQLDLLRRQIEHAEKRGLDGFDPDRLLKGSKP